MRLAHSGGGGHGFGSVGVGPQASCGVGEAGRAWCWGYGWIGAPPEAGGEWAEPAVEPIQVPGEYAFSDIAVGGGHACGLSSDGDALCWGQYPGDGENGRSFVPVHVTGGRAFRTVSAGFGHTCGITTDDEVWCWGEGDDGQLGRDPDMGHSNVPVRVDPSATRD